ncbi:hypothetical protein M5K25_020987 [Dendrobium thyrsiflorum]|uniref:Uncharacterized protein n=1 Tax=Dendrobium thyrsiflorum TaxID=117978 RepID=A0ABD0UBH7_DENTH
MLMAFSLQARKQDLSSEYLHKIILKHQGFVNSYFFHFLHLQSELRLLKVIHCYWPCIEKYEVYNVIWKLYSGQIICWIKIWREDRVM